MSGLPKESDLEKYIVEQLATQPIVTISGDELVDAHGEKIS